MNKNVALILAGGTGFRSGESIPKQFIVVNGKPLIIYTLEKFNTNPNIDYICISCHKDWIEYMNNIVNKYDINKVKAIVEGGPNGLSSAYNGIKAINDFAPKDSLVLIHDAVRPFIDQASINDNIKVAKEKGLAMCSVSLVETLAYSEEDNYSNKVVPRDNLFRILTPQTFKLSLLNELYDSEDIANSKEPSTFSLYMKKGLPIFLSKGNERNVKITYPEDIVYFKKFFSN